MNLFKNISGIIMVFISLISSSAFAQKTEIGGVLGGSYYWGDIVNSFQPATMNIGGTFFVRYHYDPRIAFRANLSYAKIGGSDATSTDSEWQKNRNLSFTTDIIEVSGIAEYNLLADKNKGRRVKSRFIPYVYGGLGFFYFNPKAINPISGSEVALQPLKLNGESYSRIALCIPLGIGFRTYITRNWQIGLELGARYSLSSYIDDVSGSSQYQAVADFNTLDGQILYNPNLDRIKKIKNGASPASYEGKNSSPGDPRGKNNLLSDVYFIGGVTVSYRIWPKGAARSYGGRAIRCPRFY